jgi:hypothetical protein
MHDRERFLSRPVTSKLRGRGFVPGRPRRNSNGLLHSTFLRLVFDTAAVRGSLTEPRPGKNMAFDLSRLSR